MKKWEFPGIQLFPCLQPSNSKQSRSCYTRPGPDIFGPSVWLHYLHFSWLPPLSPSLLSLTGRCGIRAVCWDRQCPSHCVEVQVTFRLIYYSLESSADRMRHCVPRDRPPRACPDPPCCCIIVVVLLSAETTGRQRHVRHLGVGGHSAAVPEGRGPDGGGGALARALCSPPAADAGHQPGPEPPGVRGTDAGAACPV
jgi:hypothetical protein